MSDSDFSRFIRHLMRRMRRRKLHRGMRYALRDTLMELRLHHETVPRRRGR